MEKRPVLVSKARDRRGRFNTWDISALAIQMRFGHYPYGDSASVHPNVTTKANDLRAIIKGLFPSSEFEFSFIGATALLDLARQQPPSSFQIQFSEFLTGNSDYIAPHY